MNDLEIIKAYLENMALPEYDTEEFWHEVEIMCDNATDTIIDYDLVIKKLITMIEDIQNG